MRGERRSWDPLLSTTHTCVSAVPGPLTCEAETTRLVLPMKHTLTTQPL